MEPTCSGPAGGSCSAESGPCGTDPGHRSGAVRFWSIPVHAYRKGHPMTDEGKTTSKGEPAGGAAQGTPPVTRKQPGRGKKNFPSEHSDRN